MPLLTHRRLLIAVPLVVLLLLVAVAVFFLARGGDLKSRAAQISVGMAREEVEERLGPPVLVLNNSSGKGQLLSWVDQFWQVDVVTGPDDRVESVGYMPSDSFYRRTVGRIISLPK